MLNATPKDIWTLFLCTTTTHVTIPFSLRWSSERSLSAALSSRTAVWLDLLSSERFSSRGNCKKRRRHRSYRIKSKDDDDDNSIMQQQQWGENILAHTVRDLGQQHPPPRAAKSKRSQRHCDDDVHQWEDFSRLEFRETLLSKHGRPRSIGPLLEFATLCGSPTSRHARRHRFNKLHKQSRISLFIWTTICVCAAALKKTLIVIAAKTSLVYRSLSLTHNAGTRIERCHVDVHVSCVRLEFAALLLSLSGHKKGDAAVSGVDIWHLSSRSRNRCWCAKLSSTKVRGG